MKSQFLVCLQIKKNYLNIYKIKKLFKKGITPLLCALTVFNCCCINAFALSDITASFGLAEPLYDSEHNGYLVLLLDDGNGGYLYDLLFWHNQTAVMGSLTLNGALTGSYTPSTSTSSGNINNQFSGSLEPSQFFNNVKLDITDNSLSITFYGDSTGSNDNVYLITTVLSGSVYYQNDYRLYNTGTTTWTRSYSAFPIRGYVFKGNVYNCNANLSKLTRFDVEFGTDVQLARVQNDLLSRINSSLLIMSSDLTSIKNLLLNQSSSGSIEDVSSSDISSVENKENALIGSNASTTELSVDINPVASSVVWNLVDNVITGNAKVFTMFISILTIAVIGLILNR